MDYLGLRFGRWLGRVASRLAFGRAEKIAEVKSAVEPGVSVYVYKVPRLLPAWASAQTWGNDVYTTLDKDDIKHGVGVWVLAHEITHALQWRRYGLLFPFLYLLSSLWSTITLRHYYNDNLFEVRARENTKHLVDFVKESLYVIE